MKSNSGRDFFTVNDAVQTIKNSEDVTLSKVTRAKKKFEVVGKCPLCGHSVIKGQKGFGYSNWKKGCEFVIWKNDNFFSHDEEEAYQNYGEEIAG